MSASFGAATSESRPELISATYRRLQRLGFDDAAAANLAAVKNGFAIISQPWTVQELTHLLFLRELRHAGRRWSDPDDRADSGVQAPASVIAERAAADDRAPASPPGGTHLCNADPSDGRVTLVRSMAGPNATLDLFRRSALPGPGAAGGRDGEGR